MEPPSELPGRGLEDQLEDAFRHLGYENVRQSPRPDAAGRDVVMEEVIDGRRRAVVVNCVRADTVGRAAVRRLRATVAADGYDGPVRGMVVTTGRFTEAAREYARRVGTDRDGGVELLDGADLRELRAEVGVDRPDGRLEIRCSEALRPTHPTAGRDAPVREAAGAVERLDPEALPTPEATVSLEPTVIVTGRTSARFEAAAGVVHSLDETDDLVIHADRDEPRLATEEIGELVAGNAPRIDLEERDLTATFDAVERTRFARTETAYREWAIDRLRETHATTVRDGPDAERTRRPNRGDVAVQSVDPVYLPHVRTRLSLGRHEYRVEYYAAGPSRMTTRDDFRACVHCGATGGEPIFCRNCGSVNCADHVRTERLEGGPVCTDCAVTERFALRTKYFYGEENLAVFREAYASMSLRERAMENVPLVAASVLAALLAAVVAASVVGPL